MHYVPGADDLQQEPDIWVVGAVTVRATILAAQGLWWKRLQAAFAETKGGMAPSAGFADEG
eukprot:1207094-Prorocentrum_lima.AAC.1